jgi:nicotinamidase-related amidase
MASLPVRDPVGDHLLTPQNAALLVIDYQPSQFAGVRSIDRDLLLDNIVSTVKTANAFRLPIVHSTINVATGRGQPTVPELAEVLEDHPPIDRIGRASSASSRPVRSRSAGSASPSSSSATGPVKRRWPTSSRSCSPNDC